MTGRALLPLVLLVLSGLPGIAADAPVAELIERAIYEEETVGDLDAAIDLYNRIVADAEADRAHVAQALFRLGQCQIKQGRDELAMESFRMLVDRYPDQTAWVAKARVHLPPAADGRIALEPAPWTDGEMLRFAVRAKDGAPLGDLTYSVRSETVEGRPAWRVETFLAMPRPEIAKYACIEADRESFLPLRTKLYHSQLGTLVAEYGAGERRITMNRPGEPEQPYTQELAGPVFDNEQVLYVIRRLPLAEGFETKLPITGRPGMTATANITVQSIEKVTVPAGTFPSFRVEVAVPPYVETQWFSTDPDRYAVKVAKPEAVVELQEITRFATGPTRFEEPTTGISLTAPRGWDIQNSSFRFAEHEFFLILFAPEMRVKGAVVAQKLDTPMTVREFAEMDLEIYRSRRSSYRVEEDSWIELDVAGFPAVGVTATLTSENERVREYRVYVAGPSTYYWFVYRGAPDAFDAMKDDFDSLVRSLTLG